VHTDKPRVGGFFYRRTKDGGHIGVVVKVDEANRKY